MTNNILSCQNRNEFRRWLIENFDKQEECYLLLKRGRPTDPNVFYYLDAVEEALCFGWIDSVCKKKDDFTLQRFTPRKKNGPWSELNKERVRRLERLGLMSESGRLTLPNMDVNHFKIDHEIIKALKNNDCYEIFVSFPALYQRIRAYNVMFYKNRNQESYQKALNHLIEQTKRGKMFGQWNDYGRLL